MSNDFAELDRLIEQLRSDDLQDTERARLTELLAQNPAAQQRYVQQMALAAALRERAVREGENTDSISAAIAEALDHSPADAASSEVVQPDSGSLQKRSPRPNSIVAVAAVAACLLMAFGLWRLWPTGAVTPPTGQLAAGWRVTPTGAAEYQVVEPTLVSLISGELLVESVKDSSATNNTNNNASATLRIKTPHGEAVAAGTRFFIGSHSQEEQGTQLQGGETIMLKSLTRVLVLSGVVSLTTSMGSLDGTSGELLSAELDKAPTKVAVKSNSDFALDLYKQLAKENAGENLFFSPYSISSALAMTVEGARGATAKEMGKVLRFPNACRRVGDDSQLIPWETALIHTGMAQLNRKLEGGNDPAKVKKISAEVAKLKVQRDAIAKKIDAAPGFGVPAQWVLDVERLNDEIHRLDSQINQYELTVANSMWGEQTYPFRKEFIATVDEHYDTGDVFPVDFKKNYEAERRKINTWVAEQTKNRIKDLLPQGSLNDLTRLVLTNAIYFKGDWSSPFDVERTMAQPFTLASGDVVDTPMMFAPGLGVARYGAFNADGSLFNTPVKVRPKQRKGLYPDADGFAIVELPYKGEDISMVVIAPNKATGLVEIEARLTSANLNRWVGQLSERDTHVHLPKFKMETKYTLGDADNPATLQHMGMVRAFEPPRENGDGADFSGLNESTDPADWLYISKVFHKAFLDVNEAGTEAAAATAVSSPLGGVPEKVPFTPSFRADRSFVFAIREKSTGSVLFLGRMVKPTETVKTAGAPDEAIDAIVQLNGRVEFDGDQATVVVPLEDHTAFDGRPSARDSELRHLKALDIVKLQLIGDNVTDSGLRYLRELPNLAELQLHRTSVTDAGLEQLKGLRLQSLELVWNDHITDAGVEHLAEQTGLRSLALESEKITDVGLRHLTGLTELRSLALRSEEFTDASLEIFSGLEGLERLSLLGQGVSDAGLQLMRQNAGLQELRLEYTRVTDDGLKKLNDSFADLRSLHLYNNRDVTAAGFQQLKNLEHLERLALSADPITDTVLAQVGEVSGLVELSLEGAAVTDAGLAHLQRLPGLKSLRLSYAEDTITDAGLKGLKSLTGLVELDLSHAHINGSGLQHFAEADDLVDLNLTGAHVTSAGLKQLRVLKSLQKLNMSSTEVGDAGLAHLVELSDLVEL
ncbi:MAG: serpin family protein, partial [Pirellulaceae bacterium]|nr:serpin family protein [Pirellulaceae bacterium]